MVKIHLDLFKFPSQFQHFNFKRGRRVTMKICQIRKCFSHHGSKEKELHANENEGVPIKA